MTLTDGWLERQVTKANEEISKWSDTKREVMLKEGTAVDGQQKGKSTPFSCDASK